MAKKPATIKIASKEETQSNHLSAEQVKQFRLSKEQRKAQRRLEEQNHNLSRAATAPLPGPLREAFASFPKTLLGHKLVPVCAGHMAVLSEINSPFLAAMRVGTLHAAAKTKRKKKLILKMAERIQIGVEDIGLVFFVFTRSYNELLANMELGPEAFRAEARRFWAALPPLTEWKGIQAALGAHYMACYVTAVSFELKKGPGDRTINFPQPGTFRTASAPGLKR